MYKVFLADDEIVIREGIRNNFPWEDSQFTLVGEAPDGEIALSMLQDTKPDILITDIRLPFLDGLALCHKLNTIMPGLNIIILSGYDSFAYVREAISIGVKEYLLKPVSVKELRDTMERVAKKIDIERQQQAKLNIYHDQLTFSSALLKQKLLSDLISGVSEAEIIERARTMLIDLTAKCYQIIVIELEQEMMMQMEAVYSAESIISRLADSSNGRVYMCQLQGRFVLLVKGDSDSDVSERTNDLTQTISFVIERITACKPQISISTVLRTLQAVPAAYHEVGTVLSVMNDARDRSCNHRILDVLDRTLEESLLLMELKTPRIYERMCCVSCADADAVFTESISEMGEAAIHSELLMNYVFVDIILAASQIVRDYGGVPQEVIPSAFHFKGNTNVIMGVDDIVTLSKNVVYKALEFRDEQGLTQNTKIIRKAKEFMKQHYHNPELTLKQVAAEVALSSNYFCTVFSHEVGMTFKEYITELRIEKSKELLRDMKLSNSDVATSVGYKNPSYFGYIFKKYTTYSPCEYRKSLYM